MLPPVGRTRPRAEHTGDSDELDGLERQFRRHVVGDDEQADDTDLEVLSGLTDEPDATDAGVASPGELGSRSGPWLRPLFAKENAGRNPARTLVRAVERLP
jgi:hypothetical protein